MMWNGCTTTTAAAEIYVAKHHHKREALPCRISWCDRLRNFPSMCYNSILPRRCYTHSKSLLSATHYSHSGLPRPNYNQLTSSRNRCISNCRIPISKSSPFLCVCLSVNLGNALVRRRTGTKKNIVGKWCTMKNSTSRKCRFLNRLMWKRCHQHCWVF